MLFFDHHLMIKVNNIFQFYFYNVEIFSRCTRREREFVFNISILENGAMKKQLILEVDRDFSILNFRETFRDRELLPMSALSYNFRWCPFLDSRILRIFIIVVFFGQATPIFRLLLNFDSRQCLGQELLH